MADDRNTMKARRVPPFLISASQWKQISTASKTTFTFEIRGQILIQIDRRIQIPNMRPAVPVSQYAMKKEIRASSAAVRKLIKRLALPSDIIVQDMAFASISPKRDYEILAACKMLSGFADHEIYAVMSYLGRMVENAKFASNASPKTGRRVGDNYPRIRFITHMAEAFRSSGGHPSVGWNIKDDKPESSFLNFLYEINQLLPRESKLVPDGDRDEQMKKLSIAAKPVLKKHGFNIKSDKRQAR